MNRINAVILDLDGTIANTLPLSIEAFKKALEPLLKRQVSDVEIIATFGPSEEGTIMALAPDYIDEGLNSYLYYYETLHYMCPLPFDGIYELLENLKRKNVKLGMVTGKGWRSTEISLKKFNLLNYFDSIETGNPIEARKPQCIAKMIRDFGMPDNREVIYVGDTPSDITASRTAGVIAVAAAWAETSEISALAEQNPDKLFQSIPEFTGWLYNSI